MQVKTIILATALAFYCVSGAGINYAIRDSFSVSVRNSFNGEKHELRPQEGHRPSEQKEKIIDILNFYPEVKTRFVGSSEFDIAKYHITLTSHSAHVFTEFHFTFEREPHGDKKYRFYFCTTVPNNPPRCVVDRQKSTLADNVANAVGLDAIAVSFKQALDNMPHLWWDFPR